MRLNKANKIRALALMSKTGTTEADGNGEESTHVSNNSPLRNSNDEEGSPTSNFRVIQRRDPKSVHFKFELVMEYTELFDFYSSQLEDFRERCTGTLKRMG